MSDDRSRDFSLIDEPWIMVQRPDDTVTEVSLRDALVHSEDYVRLLGELPTQAFAVIRVMLAVLHRAVGGPSDDEHWWELWHGQPPAEAIDRYLGQWRHRFWLFDKTEPFFQVADLHTAKGEMTGLDRLIAEIPPKDPFFTVRGGQAVEQIDPAEAARWLVHCQAFDVSGIKSGAVGDDRVKGGKGYPIGVAWAGVLGGLIVEGDTLWQTLLLNLLPRESAEQVGMRVDAGDRPAWEVDRLPGAGEDPFVYLRPYGPLDLYTWQARRIRLFGDRNGVTGVLVANGDRLKPQGDKDRPLNAFEFEPMSAWRHSEPQEKLLKRKPVFMPQEHRLDRALWRGISSLLPSVEPPANRDGTAESKASAIVRWLGGMEYDLDEEHAAEFNAVRRVHAVALVYGSQSSVLEAGIDDHVDLDLRLLTRTHRPFAEAAVHAVEMAEAGVRALSYLAANLERAAGAVDKEGGAGARAAASGTAYSQLGEAYLRWLVGILEHPTRDDALEEWQRVANRVLRELGWRMVADAGPSAAVGRDVATGHMCTAEADLIFTGQLRKLFPVAYPKREAKEESA